MRFLFTFLAISIVTTSVLQNLLLADAAEYTVARGSDPASGIVCGEDENAVQPPVVFIPSRTAYHAFLSALSLDNGTTVPQFHFEDLPNGVLGDSTPIILDAPVGDLSVSAHLLCSVPGCNLNIKEEQPVCPSENGRFPNDIDPQNSVGDAGTYLDDDGEKWLDVEFNDDFVLSFDEAVRGFGFVASDIGDVTGSLEIRIILASGEELQYEGGHLPLIENGEGEQQPSGVRTFWGIFTMDLNETNWIKEVRFDKDVANAAAKDGFGFDSLLAFPRGSEIIPPPPGCICILIYNAGPGCSASIGGDDCVCIQHAIDPNRGECEIDECESSGLPVPQSGGEASIPLKSDFRDNYAPSLVRFSY